LKCPHPFGNQVADRIIHHRRGDAGVQAETIGQIGRDIELAAADVDVAMRRFAERDDAGIEPMDEGAERHEIERAGFGNVQALLLLHAFGLKGFKFRFLNENTAR
jgi:hypothetical protein